MQGMFNVGIGVLILATVNVILGSLNAIVNGKFNKAKFSKGTLKAIIISGCLLATAYAGWLNPNIIAIDLGGTNVNLLTATNTILVGSFIVYATMVVNKFAVLLKVIKVEKKSEK